ncbi:MAG TPA: transposase [Ktedonobacteraceae bacterium]|nr:transposase [Ktedonobacteraceae bacterium]
MWCSSSGEVVGNPKFFHQDERKLAKAKIRHARKKKGSKNRKKACLKVARIHARIADRRRDAPRTNFRPDSYVKTKSYVLSRWPSRTWSRMAV